MTAACQGQELRSQLVKAGASLLGSVAGGDVLGQVVLALGAADHPQPGLRQSAAGNGSAKSRICRAILSPSNCMILTTLTGLPPS